MGSSFENLIDRTVKLAQGILGDIVGGSFQRLTRVAIRQATVLSIGISGIVIGMGLGAFAAFRWLETITTKPWAPPLIVAVVAVLVGLVALKSLGSGRGED